MTTTQEAPPPIDISTLKLLSGHHSDVIKDGGGCIMDIVSFVAGTPGTDFPPCVSRPLARVVQRLNDWMTADEREILRPYIERVQDTVGTPAQDRERAYICADWSCRTLMPWMLRWLDRQEDAATCEGLAPVVDRDTARVASAVMRKQRELLTGLYNADAYAAAAADAAAYADAAADAAAAAYAAAHAYAAAYAAAHAYAAAAAHAYAAAAADAKRAEQRRELISLRLQLVDRLIDVTSTEVAV